MKKISNYIVYFFLYCVIGWLYEVFLEVVVYKWGFSNRGVLFGPWLPVYGFGATLFIFLVYPLIKNKKYPKKVILYTTSISMLYVCCDNT